MSQKVLIYDFGSQYTQLIVRRIRELSVYSVIVPPSYPPYRIEKNVIAIILSGGPRSVYDEEALLPSPELFNLKIPILGICYGHQLIAKLLGGEVKRCEAGEYGFAEMKIIRKSILFKGLKEKFRVWMSHGDQVVKIPEGFIHLGETEVTRYAAMGDINNRIFGLQFHPEVVHTEYGKKILRNFLFEIAKAKGDWKLSDFVEEKKREIRERVKDSGVLLALSGGVDSSVLAELLFLSIGKNLYPVFVDTGLLGSFERKRIERLFSHLPNLKIFDAKSKFLNGLSGIVDPEEKRRVIGKSFADIFEEVANSLKNKIKFLAQGTLYPDVIESGRGVGPAAVIKTHHNVGGLPLTLSLELIEPFRELFKDEVREIGKILGLPQEVIERHPFPGPGYAVRIIGEVNKERIEIIERAERIIENEIKKRKLYNELWQIFPVLLPVKTVGVMGDLRTYEYVIAIRAVESQDGMTADWSRLPYDLLDKIARRIVGEIPGVNRVVYDITSKPPATIEWE